MKYLMQILLGLILLQLLQSCDYSKSRDVLWMILSSFLGSLPNESNKKTLLSPLTLYNICHHLKDAQASKCFRQALEMFPLTFPVLFALP